MNVVETDVAIVGSGAGGGTAAEILTHAGLRVAIVEEGPHKTSRDFTLRESDAYPALYQENAARKTKDHGITILQGRCVGGSTTVNWTTSFRTPPETLDVWRSNYGVRDCSVAELAPWFERMERRLNITRWEMPPNENNAALRDGASRAGVDWGVISRNVRGCRNLGYCGLGCPVDAKQSMLVTTIPSALARGATLIAGTCADRFVFDANDRITALDCGVVQIRARHYILAAGAIGSPAVLLRSRAADPYARVGKRTFLHPVVVSAAVMPSPVNAFAGAPQSIYSDHFLHDVPAGAIGFKLEVPPVHPVLASTVLTGFGSQHFESMKNLANTQVIIALMRDGFHEQSPGGTVELRDDGTPVLDYPMTPYLWEGARRALLAMADIQFAAGATSVMPLHEDAVPYASFAQARAAIETFPMDVLRTRVVSAHVMGGCAMGEDPRVSVADSYGAHHHIGNLSIFDGSLFPTSVGANPQLSIYGFTARNATRLAHKLRAGD